MKVFTPCHSIVAQRFQTLGSFVSHPEEFYSGNVYGVFTYCAKRNIGTKENSKIFTPFSFQEEKMHIVYRKPAMERVLNLKVSKNRKRKNF